MPRHLLSGLLLAGLLTACTDPECTTVTDPRLRIRFFIEVQVRNPTTGVVRTQLKDTAVRLVTVRGVGAARPVSEVPPARPSPLRRDTAASNTLLALLPQVADTATFVIEFDTARLPANRGRNSVFAETLRLRYRRRPFFVSEGCGFNYSFQDITIDRETFTVSPSRRIREVRVVNPTADETQQPNIHLVFYRTPR